MSMRVWTLAAVSLVVLAACSDGADPASGSPPISRGTGVCGVFGSELRIEDRFMQASPVFAPGEPITFNLRITNNSDAPAMLGHDGCGPMHYVVFDAVGRAIFDTLPPDTACTQQYIVESYAPRETREFRYDWNQDTNDKAGQAATGTYTANVLDRSAECHGDLDRAGDFTIR